MLLSNLCASTVTEKHPQSLRASYGCGRKGEKQSLSLIPSLNGQGHITCVLGELSELGEGELGERRKPDFYLWKGTLTV